MADNPILDALNTEGTVLDAALTANTRVNTQSDVTLKRKAAELTAIRSATEEGTLAEIFSTSLTELTNSQDPNSTIEDYKRLFVADQQSIALANIAAAIDENPDTLEQALPTIQDVQSLEPVYAGKEGTQRAITDSISTDLESSLAAAAEADRYMWSQFNEYAEQRGTMEKVWDGVTTLTGLDFAWDASDLLGVPMLESLGGLDRLAGTYQQMTPQEQTKFVDMLMPKLWEAYDENFIKVAAILDLISDPDYETETAISGTLEAIGIGELLALPLRGIRAIRTGMSVTKAVKSAGDTKGAAAINKEAIDGGIDPLDGGIQTQAKNSHIFDYEGTVLGIEGETDGLAPEMANIAKQVQSEMGEVREQLNDIGFIELTGLTPDEQSVKQSRALDELQAAVEGEKKQFTNAKISQRDKEGFTVQYHVDGVSTEHSVKYKRDDVGTWSSEGKGLDPNLANLLGAVFSPEAKLRAVDDSIVADVTFGGQQASRLRNQLVATAKTLSEGLEGNIITRRGKKNNLDSLLLAGDEQSKVFSIRELQTGVNLNGVDKTFGHDEIVAYYKHVNFFRDLGKLRNHALRKQLVFGGNKTLSYVSKKTGEPTKLIGVPRAWDEVSIGSDELVLSPQLAAGKRADYARVPDVDTLKGQGFEVVELTEARYVNNKRVRFAVVRKDEATTIDELPKNVVNYDAGYVPRIRKPGYFYVKEVTGNKRKTVRAFESPAAAEKYVDDLHRVQEEKINAAVLGAKATGLKTEKVERKTFRVFRDGELPPGESQFEQIEATGGSLFTGTRKKDPLLLNEDGTTPDRMNALESMQAYIENVSNIVPMSEYRAGIIQRYRNTLEAVAKSQGRTDGGLADTNDIRSTLTIKDDRVRQSLEQTRDYMLEHLGLMTREETTFAKYMTHIATMMEGKPIIGSKAVFNGMMRLGHTDPVGALKGASFNAYLGWFNPRQLYIQAQNASIALSMHPIEGVKGVARAMAMRPLMFITDPSVLASKEIKSVLAKHGEDPTNIIKRVQLFRQTGLADAITRTGDYHQMAAGLTGGTMDGLKSLARKGQVFFREGELFSRMITFDIALTRHMKKKGVKSINDLSEKDVQGISEEALVMNMNMQKENAAAWQNNIITGPATQFLQVQAKLIENLLPVALGGTGKWTAKEKGAVLAGQLALYGTVGVPIAEDAVNWLAETTGLSPSEIEEQYPHANEIVNQGFVGVFAELMGLDDVNMSEPASIVAGLDDNIIASLLSALFSGEKMGFWDAVGGPSASVVERSKDALFSVVHNFRMLAEYPDELAGHAVLDSINSIASITSTWSNAKKAMHLREYGGLLSKRGTLKIAEDQIGDIGIMDTLAVGMGFQTDAETAYWDAGAYNRDIKTDRRETVDALKRVYRDFQVDGNREALYAKLAFFLKPYDEVTQSKIFDSFTKSVFSGKSEMDKTVKEFIKNYGAQGHLIPMATTQQIAQ